jgi:hypothetical protein
MPALPPIPGYAEAVQKERELRNTAFLDVPEQIASVEVKPLTMDHLLILDAVKSPFTTGRQLAIETLPIDVSIFLWIVSPQFRPFSDNPEQRKKDQAVHRRFIASLRKLDFLAAMPAIDAYIESAFFEAPGNKPGSISYCSWIASLTMAIAEKTNWDPERIRRTPLKQLWQYLRAVSTKTLINPLSDKVRADWLAELNRGAGTLPATSNLEPQTLNSL